MMNGGRVPFEDEECDGCGIPFLIEKADFVSHDGDQLCLWCRAVFWAAMVLYEQGVDEEDVIIPTLAFAKYAAAEPEYKNLASTDCVGGGLAPSELARVLLAAGQISPSSLERAYLGWDFVRVIDRVPLIRVLPFTVFAEEYKDTQILKQVRIQVLSKYADPKTVRERYEQLLTERGVQWDDNGPGCVSHNFWGSYLDIRIRPTDELIYKEAIDESARELIERYKDYFLRKAYPGAYPSERPDDHPYSFPPPRYIEACYVGLRGLQRSKEPVGIARALDLYGKHNEKSPERAIPAFVAWHLGAEMASTAGKLKIARTLNKHLLGPCDKELLPEDSLRPDDTVWRDVKDLAARFERLRSAAYEKPLDKPIL